MNRIVKKYLVNIIGHVITNKRFDNIVNNFTPVVDNKGIKFYGLFQIPYNRGETLFTKEPDMIEFIDEHITAGDIYYDIGANVGVFSLYAAIKKQAMVYSFEPESSNYFILNKNISLNNLTGQVTAYNLAINDKSEISVLNLIANIRPGKSGNNFNEELDEDLKQFTPQYKQGVFGVSLDSLVYKYGMPCPNHIKIDVDGNEHKILDGMREVLNDSDLKTLSVETNIRDISIIQQRAEKILDVINSSGFEKVDKYRNKPYEENKVVNWYFVRS